MRNEAHWVLQQSAKFFCSFITNLNFVLVAVIVREVKRGHAFVAHQALEKLDSALDLDVITTQTETDDSLVVALKNASKLLDSNIGDEIPAQINLGKFSVIL